MMKIKVNREIFSKSHGSLYPGNVYEVGEETAEFITKRGWGELVHESKKSQSHTPKKEKKSEGKSDNNGTGASNAGTAKEPVGVSE